MKMTSHELAKILLHHADMPVAVSANNHEYFSVDGCFRVAFAHHNSGEYIMLGNMVRMNLNSPNWYLTKILHGSKIPVDYPRWVGHELDFGEMVDEFNPDDKK